MSTLIYCKNSIAATPYYIEEAALNVYSLEELSYFILNNVYLLSDRFMSVELCNWIGRELKQTSLSQELMTLVTSNAPLHIFVGHLLKSNGYASNKEIKDVIALVSTFENISEPERKKLRADRLMGADNIVDAIYEYESLLADEVARTLPKTLEGDIYHNLGTAFARLFFFDQAISCFEEAYKRNQKSQSLNSLIYAIRCKKDPDLLEEYRVKFQIPKLTLEETKNYLDQVASQDKIRNFDLKVNQLNDSPDSEVAFYDFAKATIEEFRQDYIGVCRI